jgi:hypothetical protein
MMKFRSEPPVEGLLFFKKERLPSSRDHDKPMTGKVLLPRQIR